MQQNGLFEHISGNKIIRIIEKFEKFANFLRNLVLFVWVIKGNKTGITEID